MWTNPASVTITALWDDLKANENFVLQKAKEYESKLIKNVIGTLQNVYLSISTLLKHFHRLQIEFHQKSES
jgi:hypothetical protein